MITLEEMQEKGRVWSIAKPLNWTSFQVVNKMRHVLQRKLGKRIKVGHAGTLDPLAEGLLIVCAGATTKKIDRYMGSDKTYLATVEMGGVTESYDLETPVTKIKETDHITKDTLKSVLPLFRGTTLQLPPMYSAVKHKGKRLFELARSGKKVEREPREIRIDRLEMLAFENPEVVLEIRCSKGTYIRTLAHDLGQALKTGAYLKKLVRTQIGETHTLDKALSIETWEKMIVEDG